MATKKQMINEIATTLGSFKKNDIERLLVAIDGFRGEQKQEQPKTKEVEEEKDGAVIQIKGLKMSIIDGKGRWKAICFSAKENGAKYNPKKKEWSFTSKAKLDKFVSQQEKKYENKVVMA